MGPQAVSAGAERVRRGPRCVAGAVEEGGLTCCTMRVQKYFRMSSRLEAACSSRSLCRAWGGGTGEKSPELTLSHVVLLFRSSQRKRVMSIYGSPRHYGATGRGIYPQDCPGSQPETQGTLHRCATHAALCSCPSPCLA